MKREKKFSNIVISRVKCVYFLVIYSNFRVVQKNKRNSRLKKKLWARDIYTINLDLRPILKLKGHRFRRLQGKHSITNRKKFLNWNTFSLCSCCCSVTSLNSLWSFWKLYLQIHVEVKEHSSQRGESSKSIEKHSSELSSFSAH